MRGRKLTIAGAVTAALLVVLAVLEWRAGTGTPAALLFIAFAIVAALLLRLRYPRD